MNKREKKFYERFKSENIDEEQIGKAKNMAGHLGNISSKFLLLVKMINSNLKGEFKISAMDKLKIIGAIVYVITPTDAIPDFMPLLGFSDDIAVVTYVLSKLNKLISEYEQFENEKIQERKKNEKPDFESMRVVNEDTE
ncbi:MAG: YkvA family protein [Leptotrichiaceae bacterium]|nr:YkvA family protein [Leptotrichiaceae bacterium]